MSKPVEGKHDLAETKNDTCHFQKILHTWEMSRVEKPQYNSNESNPLPELSPKSQSGLHVVRGIYLTLKFREKENKKMRNSK